MEAAPRSSARFPRPPRAAAVGAELRARPRCPRRHGATAGKGVGVEAAHPAAAAKGEMARLAFCLLAGVALRGEETGIACFCALEN